MIEGTKNVREALRYGAHLDHILIDEEQPDLLEEFGEDSDRAVLVRDNIFKGLTDEKTPQGIMAVARFYSHSMDEILQEGDRFLILDRIQDPGNMGTLIRSADAFGADGILISSDSCDVYSPKVVRAAMGSTFHVPFACADTGRIMEALKEAGVFIIGTSPHADVGIGDMEIKRPVAVILGNESGGIDDEIIAGCDDIVKIDMKGRAESLNAAVAGSILMYEIFLKNK